MIQTWRNIRYRHSFQREIYMKPVLKLYKFCLIHLLFLWSLLDISKSRTAKRPLTGNLNMFLPIKGALLPPKPTTPNLFKVCIWGDKAAVYWVIPLALVQRFNNSVPQFGRFISWSLSRGQGGSRWSCWRHPLEQRWPVVAPAPAWSWVSCQMAWLAPGCAGGRLQRVFSVVLYIVCIST